ncbi:inorganic diphosphatase [Candidatus Mycoplasma haematominutum]|uniref:inorganic diphosphatase n=1 Tax=Candidatus Mycoplasma haematominutum 'Birmingham 1' TaxID=1116213 RepID=G8C3V9_9MOLU|nr:inorganic diphosphatase [Candidatus Mycoplasma haematominutum]CCE67007.1 inorganic pyrophosphatase [Candidatus Mycoplasma haematominutum 'Birmingham 1']
MNNIYECFIEISKNSNVKYEFTNSKLKLDRVLFGAEVYPQNYGFITDTIGEDGDPLDVVLISNISLHPGVYADGRILGALEMIDSGENDLKVIAILNKDPRLSHITKLEEIPNHWLIELKQFFLNYKKLENKEVKLGEFISLSKTLEIVEESKQRYKV